MSDQAQSPETPADEPAGLVPDDATAGHPTAGETVLGPPRSEPVSPPRAAPPAWTPPAPPQDPPAGASEPSGAAAVVAQRPEIAVGAAFGGGLVLALILKRLAR